MVPTKSEAKMTKVRDATTYLRDRTIDGMNPGSDLWTLMRDCRAPPPSFPFPRCTGRCPGSCDRSGSNTWGGSAYESTTELYDVPASAVWPDIVELAGGTSPHCSNAPAHADAGRPLQALHLTDIILSQAPDDGAATVRHAALQQLLTAGRRREPQRNAVASAGARNRQATREK